MNNLVALAQQYLTPDVIARISSAFGADKSVIGKAATAAVPDGVTRGGTTKRLSRFWVSSLCTPSARSDTSLYLSRLRTSCGQGPCPRDPSHR